jgi:hypothetical protein
LADTDTSGERDDCICGNDVFAAAGSNMRAVDDADLRAGREAGVVTDRFDDDGGGDDDDDDDGDDEDDDDEDDGDDDDDNADDDGVANDAFDERDNNVDPSFPEAAVRRVERRKNDAALKDDAGAAKDDFSASA